MLRSHLFSLIKNGTNRALTVGANGLSTSPHHSQNTTSAAGGAGYSNDSQQHLSPPPASSDGASSGDKKVDSSTSTLGGKGIDGWQIMAAVCVTRHPVLCPPMSPLEHTYSQHLNKLELENSLLSDFELQIIEDNARKVLGDEELELDEQGGDQQSALEQLDMWQKEGDEFATSCDTNLELPETSVGSSLSRQVVLVQKYQIGSQDVWLLPQGPWKPGETLRQTSERIVAESCDPSLGVRIMGNAPVGFFKYKYPKDVRSKGYIGAKVFFYRGQVSSRVRRSLPLLQHSGKQDQLWLSQPRLQGKLKTSYANALSQFLIDDS